MPMGQLRISRIVYFTNLQRTDSLEIPVGLAGEVTLPSLRAICMALRPSFSAEERGLMGPLMRDLLGDPRKALWPEFADIFEHSKPGEALDLFAGRHTASLSVLAPGPHEVPRQWLLERDTDRLSIIVGDRMKVILTDEYFNFLFPPRGDGPAVEDPMVEEKVQALVAA